MAIYSSTYKATGSLDLRDMAQYKTGAAAGSSGSSKGGVGMYAGAVSGMLLGMQSARFSSQLSKMQYQLSSKQHDFAMRQNEWQNGMIGLQREAIGVQGEQARMAGRSAEVEAKLQEAMARINARLAESAAQGALHSGVRQEQSKRLEVAAFKSRQRTAIAAGGIDLTSESSVAVLTSTDMMGEIDANTINANAVRAAWGYRVEGTNSQIAGLAASANGAMASANANANAAAVESRLPSYVTAPIASKPIKPGGSSLGVAAALLSGATQIAATYYQFNKG